MARIAVVGSYGVGLTMRVPRMPAGGETLSGGAFSAGPGGKSSNQAIGARRLGCDVDLLSIVGPDAFGTQARELWSAEGVRADAVLTGEAATMSAFILVEPNGENRIVIAEGALAELSPAHVDAFADRIEGADLLMVCLEIPVATAVHALLLGRRLRTPTLLNPAPAPSAALPEQVWGAVDYLTPNRTEAVRLLAGLGADPGDGAEADAAALHRLTGATVVLTAGAEGAVVATSAGTEQVPAVTPRAVVDTTGAGDSFNAALATMLAGGADPAQATALAVRAGAHTVSIAEVIPALPYPHDLLMGDTP